MPTVPKAKPFDDFVSQSLKDFKQHLQAERMTANTITERMKGATEFARFLGRSTTPLWRDFEENRLGGG
jgi:hypothetical protein